MKIVFPSGEFDEAVGAVCHGLASEEQVRGLNELLRRDAGARDEYILRLEVHARLASDPDLFARPEGDASIFSGAGGILPLENFLEKRKRSAGKIGVIALAACVALLAVGVWGVRQWRTGEKEATSKAVAMLSRTVDARWNRGNEIPRLNAPLDPGRLRLEGGLAQVTFYSGARIVMEGPAELELISPNELFCGRGRILVEVPAQAGGFRIKTAEVSVKDPGRSIGLDVKERGIDLYAFAGSVKLKAGRNGGEEVLPEGAAVRIESDRGVVSLEAGQTIFASLLNFQVRSEAAETRRFDQWRKACKRMEKDESLLLHFDFENVAPSGWEVPSTGDRRGGTTDATLVGCQWTEGRWPEKRALEFQSVNDRMRLNVPGLFRSLTFSAWVSVKGLDRKINSLFMSDGFEPQTVHWLIRRDGVLGLTVIGADPREHQIVASPPVVTLEKFGMWLHLAVVLDGESERVIHYLNGVPVSEKALKITPPFRIGSAELGNWNAKGFPEDDPFMIRNFSGAVDEFCLFSRALAKEEIRALHAQGKPQGDTVAGP
ncbi:MAG: LamG domain-containing protein [Verrucomicrobiota bacterium]|nr:LamG domain-containing protein [Verrucomicrobiota bacterium]